MTKITRPSDTIGKGPSRIDGPRKATGTAVYADDVKFPGMLHAALATSDYPHARVNAVDIAAAAAAPGVVRVLTAADVQGENQIGCALPDQPLFVEDTARFVGDRIAMIIAETPDQARAAAKLVKGDYTPLPVVTCPVAALEPDAPAIHPGGNLIEHKKVRKGDPEAVFTRDDMVVVDEKFYTNYQEHAYLEPNGVVAVPGTDGTLTIYGTLQAPFYVQKSVTRALGLPFSKVRVIQTETGGAFGGKEDYPSEPAACAGMAALATGRPVKLVYDRTEDIVRSTKRHRMVMRERLAARPDGTLEAAFIELWVDAGGYDGLSRIVAERSNVSALGPYRCPNVRVDTYIVYTNNLFGGAYRGFGTPQTTFASETCFDVLAEKLEMSPAALRTKNIVGDGDTTISNQVLEGSAPAGECLEKALAHSEFEAKRAANAEFNAKGGPIRRGIGLANVMYGCCLHAGGQFMEGSAANLHLRQDASLELAIGGTELGQGSYMVCAQLAAKELGVPLEMIQVVMTDTARVADSGPTVASRTTIMSGNAVIDAARKIRAALTPVAADLLSIPAERVEVADGFARDCEAPDHAVPLSEVTATCFVRKVDLTANGWYAPPRKQWDNETGQGQAYSVYCFGTQIAEVEVDLVSGLTSVKRVTAVHDVGRVLNEKMLTGQVEGGVVQGLGWGLMEDLKMKDGVPLNPNFTDYLIPTALDAPRVDAIFVEDPYVDGPHGAKGIGEPTLIPAAAAAASAIRDATRLPLRELPITPEKLLLALDDAGIDPY